MSNQKKSSNRNINKPNWKSVKVGSYKDLYNGKEKKKGVHILGVVTKNHGSTIVKYKNNDGKLQKIVSSTHELPYTAQLKICEYLDNTKSGYKTYLYDDKPEGSKK